MLVGSPERVARHRSRVRRAMCRITDASTCAAAPGGLEFKKNGEAVVVDASGRYRVDADLTIEHAEPGRRYALQFRVRLERRLIISAVAITYASYRHVGRGARP